MLGLGDNLHQRAVVRDLLERHDVFLQTPWPALYHDLPVHLLPPRETSLRTQRKNARREQAAYRARPPVGARSQRVWYTHDEIRRHGSFMAAMAANCGTRSNDFRLPIPDGWELRAEAWRRRWQALNPAGKPLMLYRPLVERTEWNGCAARNPDAEAYAALARSLCARYFVVSVADLQPGVEWIVSPDIGADVECHAGELTVDVLAAIAATAGLVFCSPGFALVLAQAVGAPCIGVFGGHESGRLYRSPWNPQLYIEPITPCECFSKTHACNKQIDMPVALQRIEEFTRAAQG